MELDAAEERSPFMDLHRRRARQTACRQYGVPALALAMSFCAGALWAHPHGAAAVGSRVAGVMGIRTDYGKGSKHSRDRFRHNLVFNEDFDTFDLSVWKHEITMSAGGNWEFQWYTNNRTNSFVENGVFHIHPTLTATQFGEDFIEEGGIMDIWGTTPASQCTSNAFWGCFREGGAGGNVLSPVQSAKVRTYESFSFRYGRLEVRAKLPRGDWIWPAIWLLPKLESYGPWPASGEIDLMESRGNANVTGAGSATIGCTLHWGPSQQENPWDPYHGEYSLEDGTDFSDNFHTFGLYWDEDEIYTYVDSDENVIMRANINESFWDKGLRTRPHWTKHYVNPWRGSPNNNAPYDQEFYLVMNLAVGGINGYFNSSYQPGMPWQNVGRKGRHAVDDFWKAKDQWYPTWKGDAADMQVDWVRVWQD